LSRAAVITEGRGYSQINRTNRQRVIDITANVDAKKANAAEILKDLKTTILRRLIDDYPGLHYTLQGEARERRDSMHSMMRDFILALLMIYALLAIPFKSYSQPL